ncbi:phage virion morphogenesis protein [Thermomonas sp.]|uniref:phage virion morphogenesis protein n=1 Tax=Thermomonas sp. TaxID=1971895 RepID=UPI002628A56C|nr:phage virion morphogenesis protein [Thermomonas sp.]
MTDFQVNVIVDSAALQDVLSRLFDFGEDQSVAMADIAEGWMHRTQDRFDTQRAPDGSAWAPLSEKYKQRKRRAGYPETLLYMEGRLRNELRPDYGPDFAAVATAPLPYAALHQFGGTSGMAPGPAAVPARPYLGASPEDLAWMEKTLAGYLRRLAG